MSNLLYNSSGQIKIADFGMARQIPQPVSHAKLSPKVMTLWYRSPEMLLGK
jgi:serine/threonine protein kinase